MQRSVMTAAAADTIDHVVEIERLAVLEPDSYKTVHVNDEKRLGMRVTVLNTAVKKKRPAPGLDAGNGDNDGQGRAVKLADVLPCHEPVAGEQIAETLAAAAKTHAVLSDTPGDTIAL